MGIYENTINKATSRQKSTWRRKAAECVGDLRLKRIIIGELPADDVDQSIECLPTLAKRVCIV